MPGEKYRQLFMDYESETWDSRYTSRPLHRSDAVEELSGRLDAIAYCLPMVVWVETTSFKEEHREHRYHNVHELILITHGSGAMRIRETECSVEPGTVLFIRAGDIHSLSGDNLYEGLVIHFGFPLPPPAIPEHTPLTDAAVIQERLRSFRSTRVPPESDIIERFHAIHREYLRRDTGRPLLLGLETMTLLIQILQLADHNHDLEDSPAHPDTRDGLIVSDLKSIIDRNYGKDFKINLVLKRYDLDPSYIRKFFKKREGITIHNYLKQVRMKHARQLLLHTAKTAREVSAEVGLHDYSHFIRCFKDIYGITPLEIRRSQRTR